MKYKKLKLTMRFFAAVALSLSVAACERTKSWSEQVQLSDGTILVVERSVRYAPPSGEIGASWDSRFPMEGRLTFTDTESARQIVWQEPDRVAVWVDHRNGKWWVVGILPQVCKHVGQLDRPWVAYVLLGSKWQEVDAQHGPDVVSPNLLFDWGNYRITKSLSNVSLADKARINADSRVGPYSSTIKLGETISC